jgi:hypothetical protein
VRIALLHHFQDAKQGPGPITQFGDGLVNESAVVGGQVRTEAPKGRLRREEG